MSGSLTLAPRLDSPAADVLAHDLLEARGSTIQINAESVTFCGALAMQILVSARRQWIEDGQTFSIENPSNDLVEACRLLGVAHDEVGISENSGDPK